MLIRAVLLGLCFSGICLPNGTVAQADDGVKLVISPQGPLSKPAGDNMFLRCSLEPEAAKGAVQNVRWLNPSGDLIPGSTRGSERLYTQSSEPSITQLYITNLQTADGGDYSCVADFPGHNQLTSTINIEVFQNVKFEDAPAVQNPISGTDGKIKCEVSGNPAPEVDWLRDDVSINTGDRYKVDMDGLVISGINQEDDGEYTCRAVVAATGGYATRKIKVEVYSRPVFDSDELQNIRGTEQKTVSLTCGATGRPTPDIKWTFVQTGEDVTKMEDEQRTLHHTVDPVTGTMTINDLQKRHQGEYKCTAENAAGVISKSSSLFVVERPRFDIVSNVTESLGRSATLHCTVRGDPPPTLQYAKEGSEIPFVAGVDPRITVSAMERELKVTINQLTREDDGLYVCVANNEAGTEQKSSHITVKFPPSFQNTPMSNAKTWLENKEPVNLTCIAESIPNATIQWQKQQRNTLTGAPMLIITDTMEHIKIENRGPSSSLLISPRNSEDFGNYDCIATNELGEARHVITLHQATFPGPISLVEFAEVTATTIRFNLAGPNEPNNLDLQGYEVYYHEAGVGDFGNAMKRAWEIGVPYTLDNLKPAHRYLFRFYARNAVGLSQETRDFEREMPDFGPPRPPGLILPSNESIDASRYRLQWEEPADNGKRILDYELKYWKDGEENRAILKLIAAPATSYMLTGLQPSTFYHYNLTARNERGVGPGLTSNFTTAHAQSASPIPKEFGVLMSTPVIIGISVGSVLLVLLLIDCCLYCTLKRGLTAFICRRCCGQSKSLKGDADAEKLRTVDETDLHYEKQPLTTTVTETTLKTTYREAAELEPDDKPSPQ